MYPYIVCTCGRSLGDIYDIFRAMRRDIQEEYFKQNNINADPSLVFVGDFKVNLGGVLDQLQLKLPCCRTRMMTQVLYKDVY